MIQTFLRWLKVYIDRWTAEPNAMEARCKELVNDHSLRTGLSGQFKRRLVHGAMAKEFPDLRAREIGLMIERAVNGLY